MIYYSKTVFEYCKRVDGFVCDIKKDNTQVYFPRCHTKTIDFEQELACGRQFVSCAVTGPEMFPHSGKIRWRLSHVKRNCVWNL